jgi:hypothetical protein
VDSDITVEFHSFHLICSHVGYVNNANLESALDASSRPATTSSTAAAAAASAEMMMMKNPTALVASCNSAYDDKNSSASSGSSGSSGQSAPTTPVQTPNDIYQSTEQPCTETNESCALSAVS